MLIIDKFDIISFDDDSCLLVPVVVVDYFPLGLLLVLVRDVATSSFIVAFLGVGFGVVFVLLGSET